MSDSNDAGRSSNNKMAFATSSLKTAAAVSGQAMSMLGSVTREQMKKRSGNAATSSMHDEQSQGDSQKFMQQQQQKHQQQCPIDENNNKPSEKLEGSFEDSVAKAKTAAASEKSLRKGANAARNMGLHKHAASMEQAADAAKLAGRAAKVADTPIVQKAMQNATIRRMVESSGQRIVREAMKQSTKQ